MGPTLLPNRPIWCWSYYIYSTIKCNSLSCKTMLIHIHYRRCSQYFHSFCTNASACHVRLWCLFENSLMGVKCVKDHAPTARAHLQRLFLFSKLDISNKSKPLWTLLVSNTDKCFVFYFSKCNALYIYMEAKLDPCLCRILICFWPLKPSCKLQYIFLIQHV